LLLLRTTRVVFAVTKSFAIREVDGRSGGDLQDDAA
jgi:hypothetical protein